MTQVAFSKSGRVIWRNFKAAFAATERAILSHPPAGQAISDFVITQFRA